MSDNILHSSATNEWYTPAKYVEAARAVMGVINLDPASCEIANELCVRAGVYHAKEHDGLSLPWYGKVFCNPPYGKGLKNKSNQDIWSAKMIKEFRLGNMEEGILLVNSATAQNWFQRLWEFPICFVTPRIKFIDETGKPSSSPGHPNVFVYIGHDNWVRFEKHFSQFGHVVTPRHLITEA